MRGFTEIEVVRLTRMRDRFRNGVWPAQSDGRPLNERLGIAMHVVPLGVGDSGVVRYRCILARKTEDGLRTYEALFQVMETYPVPPEEEPDLGTFLLAQHRRADALRQFLGPRAFAELLQEVGIV